MCVHYGEAKEKFEGSERVWGFHRPRRCCSVAVSSGKVAGDWRRLDDWVLANQRSMAFVPAFHHWDGDCFSFTPQHVDGDTGQRNRIRRWAHDLRNAGSGLLLLWRRTHLVLKRRRVDLETS